MSIIQIWPELVDEWFEILRSYLILRLAILKFGQILFCWSLLCLLGSNELKMAYL